MAKDESQIKTSCAQCGEMMLFPERHRGMKGRCPSCSAILTIGEYVYRDKFEGELTLADDATGSSAKSQYSDLPQAGFSAAETDRIRSARYKPKETPHAQQETPAVAQSGADKAPVLVPVQPGGGAAPIVGVPLMVGPVAGHSAAVWSNYAQLHPVASPYAQNVPVLIPIAWPTAPSGSSPQFAPSDSREAFGTSTAATPEAIETALTASFRGCVPRRPYPLSQRAGLFFRTVLSLAPLAAYLLTTFALLALVVWHAVANSFLLPDPEIGFTLLWLVTLPIYIAGLVVFGGLALLFAKHLFAPRRPAPQPTLLSRESAPRVYQWAERIAVSIGSPKPDTIAIDSSVDPRMDFVAKTAETPRGYQLVIGAPLIATTTLPQLTAIVSQTMGLRVRSESPTLRRLARGIWRWFETNSGEPDLWDELAKKAADEREGIASMVYWGFVGGAALVRRALWLGERSEAVIVSPLERQWTLDADYYATRLTGQNVFEQTLRRLRVIRSAWRATLEQARQDRADGKKIPNLPKVLADNLRRMPAQVEAQLAATADRHETDRFSKLPSDRDRIAAAKKIKAVPMFECELRSVQLFVDFDALARKATRRSAVELYGRELAGTDDADEVEETPAPTQSTSTRLPPSTISRDQFFSHAPMEMRAWQPIAGTVGPKRPLADIVSSLVTARALVAGQKIAHIQAYTQWNQARILVWEGEAAVLLMENNLPLMGTPLAGRFASYQAAYETIDRGRMQELAADQQLRQLEKNVAARLFTAHLALREPQILAKLGEGTARLARVELLLDLLLRISKHLPALQIAQRQLALLNTLHATAARMGGPLAANQTLDRRQPIADEALRCREAFSDAAFPFETAVSDLSMAEFLLPQAILPRITMESIPAISRMADRLQWLHDRIVNELCGTALDVERALGIK